MLRSCCWCRYCCCKVHGHQPLCRNTPYISTHLLSHHIVSLCTYTAGPQYANRIIDLLEQAEAGQVCVHMFAWLSGCLCVDIASEHTAFWRKRAAVHGYAAYASCILRHNCCSHVSVIEPQATHSPLNHEHER